MKIKSHIRSVQLIFSIFMFLIFAGLTGCKDDGAEFLEKELVQEESTETSGVDLEQEDPTDAESGVSEKKSEEKQVDTVQETAAAKQQPEISEIPETIYVDICGAVTSPRLLRKPVDIFRKLRQVISTVRRDFLTDSRSMCLPRRKWTAR